MDDKITAQEAAKILHYSRRHVYRLLRDGTLKAERFGTTWMIDRAEAERVKNLQDANGRLPPREG